VSYWLGVKNRQTGKSVMENRNQTAEKLSQPSPKEYYEYMSHQIEREDGLINTRITWMLTFEGFLFATLALIGQQGTVRPELYAAAKNTLPVLGALIGFLAYLSVEAALSALKHLKSGWESRDPKELFPRAFGKRRPHHMAALHSRLLPLAVVIAWICIRWYLW
jgi:hypothetical protein